jgi:hypothetical protein
MIALLRGEAMAESELATAASDLSMAVVPAAVSASLRQGVPHGFPALSVGSNEE